MPCDWRCGGPLDVPIADEADNLSGVSPDRDPRWAHFIGGLDQQGQPLPLTIEVLEDLTGDWANIVAGIDGAPGSDLLATSRKLVVLSWFHYELLVHACLISLQAVEASLRQSVYPDVAGGVPLLKLVKRAERDGVVDERQGASVRAGVRLRNELSHPDQQSAYTLGMVDLIVRVSHQVVRDFTEWQRRQPF